MFGGPLGRLTVAESVPTGPDIVARPIRMLAGADLRDCLALAADRGWSPEEHKWSLLLEVGDGYGVDDPAGGLAGAVVLTRYGHTLAAVGMMLVAARHGGRGLGRALMTHLLAQAGGATVFLYATKDGRPLYEKLGFRTIGAAATMVGQFRPAVGNRREHTRPAREHDLATILNVDADGFGGDRAHVVRRLFTLAEQVHVLERDRRIAGYAAAWRNGTTRVIGPVIARDVAGAQALITDLAVRCGRSGAPGSGSRAPRSGQVDAGARAGRGERELVHGAR